MLPETNFVPPFNVTRASHVTLTVLNLKRSRQFYVEVLGLIVSDEDTDTIFLRGIEEQCHHSLTLKRTADAPVCERVGFRVFTEADIEAAKRHFDGLGLTSAWVDIPFQTRTLHVHDAVGTPLEFCVSMATRPRLHTKTLMHRGGRAMRLDHYQVLVNNPIEAASFYAKLGFRVSDYLRAGPEGRIAGIFLHRKNNPWDIVFIRRPGPRLHHIGYVVESLNDMVRACDDAGNLGLADTLEYGPARHGHQHSYFTYLRDPDGHRIELLLPAIQIIDYEDGPQSFSVTPGVNSNLWGALPPESWIADATIFPPATSPHVPSPAAAAEA